MDSILISSLNCQGLGNPQKRRDVFHYLKQKAFSIYCLQDTHFDKKLIKYIKAEWGYKCFFSCYSSNSRGVAILLNNNFEFKVNKVHCDENGNYIVMSFSTMDKDLLLVNIYGPNRDNPNFYEKLTNTIKNYKNHNIIAVGDWNLVLDPSLDYDNYKHINNPKSREVVEDMITQLELTDIWRENNPECKRFTWRKTSPLKQSRLDFFLLSEYLLWYFEDADILPGYRSDHSMITLKLKFRNNIKPNSFWKFNCSLLKDRQYVDEINREIDSIIAEYAAEHYEKSTIPEIPKSEIELQMSEKVFLDFLLMKIRSKTIAFATMKKRKAQEKEDKLLKDIETLERSRNKTENDIKILKEKNKELTSLREKRIQGVVLRSKAKWVAEGEKVTKYFCSLEKRNYVCKRMSKLVSKHGLTIEEPHEIKEEVRSFYENLYKARKLENTNIAELINEIPKLSEDEKKSLEGEITLEEAGSALKNMNNGKSPGTDGFGAEFFKFFWKQLGPFVVRALNQAYRDGELSTTQKEGLITCIPKGNKPKEYIKNWRPISLLNVIYKIGSACIANRIKKVLPQLINDDQTGFITNRYIGDNIRLIYDLMDYLATKQLPGLLLCLDFEKAFDSLDWCFMLKVLKAYGFGNSVCRWIETFYYDIKSRVIVNGQATQWFNVRRGCRQGDPISPYLFVLSVEILAIMIREDKEIKGIHIADVEHKISQFADDTQLINNGDKKCFEKSIEILDKFGKTSGLFINAEKTEAVWLGSYKNSQVKYMPHLDIVWNPNQFKILGVWFTQNLEDGVNKNYDEKFLEIKALFNIWLKRNITPLGRVAVLKSLILSKLIHLWILLPDPPDHYIKSLQKMCFNFVWGGKQDRISRKTVTKSVKNGGLNIPDIKKHISALKLMWIRKLFITTHKWKNIATNNFPFLRNLQCYGPCYLCMSAKNNTFWAHTFKAYKEFCNCVKLEETDELLAEPVFYNEKFKIGHTTIKHKKWMEKGIYCVSDFIENNGDFLTFHEFVNKYNIKTDFITFNGCITAIKEYMRKTQTKITAKSVSNTTCALKLIHSVSKGTKLYYDILANDDSNPKCCSKWTERLNVNLPWKKVFLKIHKIQEVKLKWLQIRIVHRIIATNIILKEMGIVPNHACDFCKIEKDSIDHLFWECATIGRFWQALENLMKEKCTTAANVKITKNIVLFGIDNNIVTDKIFDQIILLGKLFIYKCKFDRTTPSISSFKKELCQKYKIEEYNAKISLDSFKFYLDWIYYKPMFMEDS